MSQTTSHDPLADLHTQALASLEQGDAQAARQVWEAILQIDPEHEGARHGLGSLDGSDEPTGVASGFDAIKRAALARAREKIALGQIEEAAGLLAELAFEDPGDAEIAVLLEETQSRLPVTAAPVAAASAFDLQLDLDVAANAPARKPAAAVPQAVATKAPAAPKPDADAPSIRDLLDAVGSIDDDPPEARWPENSGPVDAAAGSFADTSDEARTLVGAARSALEQGRNKDAIAFAGRALALADNYEEADDILAEARGREQRQADDAEILLAEAIEEFERGRVEVAVPLFRQVLQVVPGHAEAVDYLRRSEGTSAPAAPVAPSPPSNEAPAILGDDVDVMDLPSISLAGTAPQADPVASAAVHEDPFSDLGEEEFDTAGQPKKLPPSSDPLWGAGAAHGASKTRPAPASPAATVAIPPPVNIAPPPVTPPSAAQAPAAPLPSTKPARARRGGGSRVIRIAVAALLFVGLAGAAWYALGALGILGGDTDRADVKVAAADAGAIVKRGRTAKPQREGASQSASAPVANEQNPASEPAPRYTSEDVPRLVREAQAALDQGDPARAVELLAAAQTADPRDFDVLDRLETARVVQREHQQAQERIAEARVAFERGSYDEALRLFYRLPAEHKPQNLDRWIAAGWYNMGVLALQSGQIAEARRFLSDSLEHDPENPETIRLREVAQRYRTRDADDAFRVYVNGLELRALPD